MLTYNNCVSSNNADWTLFSASTINNRFWFNFEMHIECDNDKNIWIVAAGYEKNFLTKFDGDNFEYYSRDEYPQISIDLNCIEADTDNNIWIGSESELYRFDGIDFQIYDIYNSPLKSGDIIDIQNYEDKLLIASENELYYFDGEEWIVDDSVFKEFTGTDIYFVTISPENDIWVYLHGTYYSALLKKNGDNWISLLSSEYPFLARVAGLDFDNDGNLWLSTNFELIKMDKEFNFQVVNDEIFEDDYFREILNQEKDNILWIGGEKALYYLKNNSWSELLFSGIPHGIKRCAPAMIDGNNNIWMYNYSGYAGFAVYNPEGLEGINYEIISVREDQNVQLKISPNPASEQTKISYSLDQGSQVQIQIMDMLGNVVLEPLSEYQTEGNKALNINISLLKTDVYYCRICINQMCQTEKLVVVK